MAIKKLGAGLGTGGPRALGLGHGAGEPRFSDGWRWTAEGWKAPADAAPQGSRVPNATARADAAGEDEPIDLFILGQHHEPDDWFVSTWLAGQSSLVGWSPDMVRERSDGGVELMLAAAPAGSPRPVAGGEIQSVQTAATGTWTWVAEAPDMVDGAVFGLFLYRANPWIEFDFEFVGGDTTQVQLAVHMLDAQGRHIVNTDPVVIDLGFDAAEGLHAYQITLTDTGAVFRIDGGVVAYFSGADMPGGVWSTGSLNSFVDLWAVDPTMADWAGSWTAPATPLVAHVASVAIQPGVVPGGWLGLGGAGNDTFVGTQGADVRDGLAGNDAIGGGDGNDRLQGGVGDDTMRLDRGDDWVDGGEGTDWLRIGGTAGATVDLDRTRKQATGYGDDTILGIEHVAGGAGADRLLGSHGANNLVGGAGDDAIDARSGADTVNGGAGRDTLSGWRDGTRDAFVFSAASHSAVGSARDVVLDFEKHIDVLDLRGIDADASRVGDQAFAFAAGPAARAVWVVGGRADVLVRGDLNGDAVADFEIQVNGVWGLQATELLL